MLLDLLSLCLWDCALLPEKVFWFALPVLVFLLVGFD